MNYFWDTRIKYAFKYRLVASLEILASFCSDKYFGTNNFDFDAHVAMQKEFLIMIEKLESAWSQNKMGRFSIIFFPLFLPKFEFQHIQKTKLKEKQIFE